MLLLGGPQPGRNSALFVFKDFGCQTFTFLGWKFTELFALSDLVVMVRMFFEGMHGQLGQPCFLQKCLQTEGERAHLLLDFSLEVDAFAAVTEVELEQEVDLIRR